ncbi:MAG: response regulator [Bacteroidales bacterium]
MKFPERSKFLILVADEEITVYEELIASLDDNTLMKLTHCKTVNDLMDWCETESIPDLVLLDSGFGEGKAYTIASYLKMKFGPQPVIVAMPYFGITPLTFALMAGCDEVICKPVHSDELLAVFNKWNDIMRLKS